MYSILTVEHTTISFCQLWQSVVLSPLLSHHFPLLSHPLSQCFLPLQFLYCVQHAGLYFLLPLELCKCMLRKRYCTDVLQCAVGKFYSNCRIKTFCHTQEGQKERRGRKEGGRRVGELVHHKMFKASLKSGIDSKRSQKIILSVPWQVLHMPF